MHKIHIAIICQYHHFIWLLQASLLQETTKAWFDKFSEYFDIIICWTRYGNMKMATNCMPKRNCRKGFRWHHCQTFEPDKIQCVHSQVVKGQTIIQARKKLSRWYQFTKFIQTMIHCLASFHYQRNLTDYDIWSTIPVPPSSRTASTPCLKQPVLSLLHRCSVK